MCGNLSYVATDLTVITGTVLTGTVITETGIQRCGNQVSDQINKIVYLVFLFKKVSHAIKRDDQKPRNYIGQFVLSFITEYTLHIFLTL